MSRVRHSRQVIAVRGKGACEVRVERRRIAGPVAVPEPLCLPCAAVEPPLGPLAAEVARDMRRHPIRFPSRYFRSAE